ncbi:MAG TPA: hypothetical protein VGG51_01630 [Candidatus Cybelea sp.]|jgi:hypothetical protein
MKLTLGSRASGVFVTLALLTGCSAAGNQAGPVAYPGQPATAKAAGDALLYVVDNGANTVSYLSYPKGKTLGTLTGFGSVNGSCVDAKGDVFITDSHNSELDEFAHGSRTIRKRLKDTQDYMLGCSVDPVSGNLAVAAQPRDSSPGGVAIFTHAKGKPKEFEGSPVYLPSHCTYDDKGDLFVDGSNGHAQFALAELPAKSKAFVTITLDESIAAAGGLHWDGTYLAVDDQGVGYQGSTVYRFAISGSSGTTVSKVALRGSRDVDDFWIDGGKLIGPDQGVSSAVVRVWKYPAGGKPQRSFGSFVFPVSDAVSL